MSEAQSYQAGNIDKDRVVYLASDFDNVTRLFLDAAERCIASERREKELQQRLTAADERANVLEGLLRTWRHGRDMTLKDCAILRDRTDAALKPAEGGGDESI